jgi:ribosomal protein S18 acetylase RimI-like enzyme
LESSLSSPASQDRIVEALEQNLWALWSRFGRGEGCALHDRGDALWFDTPIPTLPYNAVLRFSVDSNVDRRLDDLFRHYRDRGVPFMWIIHPTAQPSDLPERLQYRGLEQAELCPGMALDLNTLAPPPEPPAGVEIREVVSSDTEKVLEMVAWRWDVPSEVAAKLSDIVPAFELGVPGSEVRCWLAWKEGQPLSKVILNVAAGAAGIYGVVTRPEARGLGLARILTLHALHAARAADSNLAVLHSSPMAVSLYERMGFRSVRPFLIFAPPQGFHV